MNVVLACVRRFRYPFAACELLCSEVDAVLDTLVHSSAALGDLFAPLRQAAAPDSLLAGYCARVVAVLVVRKGITLLAWLQVRFADSAARSCCPHQQSQCVLLSARQLCSMQIEIGLRVMNKITIIRLHMGTVCCLGTGTPRRQGRKLMTSSLDRTIAINQTRLNVVVHWLLALCRRGRI